MIHTDGTPTAASHRPTHGGYPPAVPSQGAPAEDASDPRGAAVATPEVGPVWQGDVRVDVTFSLPAFDAARQAASAGVDSVQGCTLSGPHYGYWEGEDEHAFTISRIGASVYDIPARPIVAAVIAAGCIAVQVESWTHEGYHCSEWRAS